jgi:hypothetical protein
MYWQIDDIGIEWVRECEASEYEQGINDMENGVVAGKRPRTSRGGALTSKGIPRPPNTGVVWVKGQTLVLAMMGPLRLQA